MVGLMTVVVVAAIAVTLFMELDTYTPYVDNTRSAKTTEKIDSIISDSGAPTPWP